MIEVAATADVLCSVRNCPNHGSPSTEPLDPPTAAVPSIADVTDNMKYTGPSGEANGR